MARALRGAAARPGHLLERLLRRLAVRQGDTQAFVATSPGILDSTVFWITILFFLTAAARVLGVEAFSDRLTRIVDYLPTPFAGALIIAGGVLVSVVARDMVIAAAAPTGRTQWLLLGRSVQAVILTTALIIGVDQIGTEGSSSSCR